MKKNRITILVLFLLTVAAVSSFAQIGENFKKNSFSLGGYGSLYVNLDNVFSQSNDDLYWSASVYPDFSVFVKDNLALSLVPGFRYSSDKTTDVDINRFMRISFFTGLEYYTTKKNDAFKGMVTSFGGGMSVRYMPGITDLVAGVDTARSSSLSLALELYVRLNFFVNERTSVYIDLRPELETYVAWWDSFGSYDTNFIDDTYVDFTLGFGVAYFIPSKLRLQL